MAGMLGVIVKNRSTGMPMSDVSVTIYGPGNCIDTSKTDVSGIANFSGGIESAMSLRQLSDWCSANVGPHHVSVDVTPRPFDIPWIVLDSAKAARVWQWEPRTPLTTILTEIAEHARAHPQWLDLSAPL